MNYFQCACMANDEDEYISKRIVTLNLLIARMRTISGESNTKQPMPLSQCRSSLYFNYKEYKQTQLTQKFVTHTLQ